LWYFLHNFEIRVVRKCFTSIPSDIWHKPFLTILYHSRKLSIYFFKGLSYELGWCTSCSAWFFCFFLSLNEKPGISSNRPWWLPYPSIFSVLITSHRVLCNILKHHCYIYILTGSYPVIWIDLFCPAFHGLKLIQSRSVSAITLSLDYFLMIINKLSYLMAMPVIAVGCTSLMMWQ
jgi:hypothetical protein